jgi:hypothetical protein
LRKYFLHIICLSALFQVTACEKEKNKPEYTVSGTLRESCGAPPKAGAYLELFQDASGSGLSQSQTLHTTTDNQGRFSFTYKDQTNIPLSLYYGTPTSSTKILMGIPNEKNVELGNIYINGKGNFYIRLNAFNSHTSADTLYFTNFHEFNKKYKLSGPFSNGFLDSLNNVSIGDAIYPDAHSQLTLGWKLNQGNWNLVHFDVRPCDTSIVQINLN